jgi:magnesium chelatase family protein
VSVSALQGVGSGEGTARVRERVERARAVQRARASGGETTSMLNATLSAHDVERVARLCESGARLIATAVERLALSARAYAKVLRVARTLADLDGVTAIRPSDVAEAISYRALDRTALLVSASAA